MSPRASQSGLAALEHVVLAAVLSFAVVALAGLACVGVTKSLPPAPTPATAERCSP